MTHSRHPLLRFGQPKGRIRRALVFGAPLAALCALGLTLSWTQPSAEEAKAVSLSPGEVMANLTAPPAPGSFAVADDHAGPQPPSKEERLAAAQAVAAEVATAFATHDRRLAENASQSAERAACVGKLDTFLSSVAIQFDVDQIAVSARDAPLLQRISEEILNCPEAYVMVAGHTDGSGTDAVNMELSWARADHTLNHLVAMGVDPNAIEAVGFGAGRPLSQGSDEEAAADRRVEFRVLRLR